MFLLKFSNVWEVWEYRMIFKAVVSRQIINHSQDKTHLAENGLAGWKSVEITQGVLIR